MRDSQNHFVLFRSSGPVTAILSAVLALVFLAPGLAFAQADAEFDPTSTLPRIADINSTVAAREANKETLADLRQEISQYRSAAEECENIEKPNVDSLQKQFAVYDDVTDYDVDPNVFSQWREIKDRLAIARARQSGCIQVINDSRTAIEAIDAAQLELSTRFLWQRTDNMVQLAVGLPAEVRDWPKRLRGSVELKLTEGLSAGVLLGLILVVGFGAVIIGVFIRQRFGLWYVSGNPPNTRPSLKYLLPKPIAYYAPLLLEGLALTLTLVLSTRNSSIELPVIRVALALAFYALGSIVMEWATGPLSPAANVAGLIPDHVSPLRRRIQFLIFVLVANFIVSGHAWVEQEPVATDPLIQFILLSAMAFAMLFLLLYLRHIPGLQGRFRIVRLLGLVAILVGTVALILGYQNFANYVIYGVVQSAIALIALWILLWLAVSGFEALAKAESPMAIQIGSAMGVTKDKPSSILGFMQLISDLTLWLGFVVFVIGVWDTSGNTLESLTEILMEGKPIGDVQLVPVDIIAGILGFSGLIVLTGWIRRWVDRRWFRHLGIDRGARDALVTMIGYAGFVFALLFGLKLAGIDLGGLAFVAGGLALGIGFGLQAIASNFVSGLILLLERPIKAGDFVSVGEIEGFIRQIRIRATEIETLDDQNVLVPNSELVSGRVTNWVLRDPQGRLRVRVGVAYGSNVEQVRDILVQVATKHPEVITDGSAPAPRALFMSFGDSSLDFELRVRIKRIERRFTVQSDLNFEIDAEFRKAGVTIPFPQRDLHLISTPDQPAVVEAPVQPAKIAKKPSAAPRKAEQITRRQTHTAEITATIESVWSALTDSETCTRWLAPEAKITAKIGGKYELLLANDQKIEGHIDIFMPPRRLRMVLKPREGDAPLASGPITEEIELQENDDTVTVTVTVAGIPAIEDWEQYYRSTEDRWSAGLEELAKILSGGGG